MRDTAIRNTHATVCTINGDSDARDANGNVVVLDESAITTEVTRLQGVYDGQAYARARKAKYDALNQFELISDDAINGTTTHKDAIVAIKAKYPKG
ncbi:MAG TPA: hypothetical protein DEZ08_08980 [Dehalococcoidia bacterium]|jgi:hypothetical protein|nr:hypothetical protein [Dehalococcoidia bacterium]|tara:strand:+ start:1706 stop:1993 length:288 start_codon:yes stop_codon:yes gene_type:complete